MNIKKEYIECNCNSVLCSHKNDPCCRVCTEVVRTTDYDKIDIFFMGMGAGKDEDINTNPNNIHHQPFFGRSGSYLRSILKWMWDTGECFNIALSNNVRCHPKNQYGKDREPTTDEIKMCIPWVINDINSLNPRIVMPLGKNATLSLLHEPSDTSMGKLRALKSRTVKLGEKVFTVIPTYHPSYLCRTYGTFKPLESNDFDNRVISDIRRAFA